VPELDPYATLGVARQASRADIARAYRRLAKRLHPDVGGEAVALRMRRVNEAWWILSDGGRRADWDRAHPPASAAAHWSPTRPGTAGTRRAPQTAPAWAAPSPTASSPEPYVRPRPLPETRSTRDSGWLALGVIGVGGAVLGLVILLLGPAELGERDWPWQGPGIEFDSHELSFAYPESWTMIEGDGAQAPGHRVIAQLANFQMAEEDACTSLLDGCDMMNVSIPPGGFTVLITAWSDGSPSIRNPATGLPSDARRRVIGGAPAAMTQAFAGDHLIAWWQLSPPGFPARWFEVQAEIATEDIDPVQAMIQVEQMLDTLCFGPLGAAQCRS